MQVLTQRVLTFLGSFYSCSQKYKKVWHFLRKTLDICLRFGYNNTRRQGHGPRRKEYADVAELADALDSGSSSLKRVWVQIPSSAPKACDKKDVTGFFLCCTVKKWRFRQPIFGRGFTVLSNHFRAVFPTWCPLFLPFSGIWQGRGQFFWEKTE